MIMLFCSHFLARVSCHLEVRSPPIWSILSFLLLLNVHQQHLGPEGQGLGLLYQLLVGGVRLDTHHNCALLGVNLGIKFRIPDQVDNPPLRLVGGHVELLRQHGDGDALVDPAERLKDHHPGVLNKVVKTSNQEKVIDQNRLAISQLLLSSIKVKVDVQILDEAGDGVLVGVGLLLDDLDQVLHHISPGTLVTNDSGGQISQNPRTGGLDGVEIRLLVEKQSNDQISALGMVEEDKQAPVNEPGSLLQSLQIASKRALINKLFQPIKILKSRVPILHQNLGSQLAPHSIQIILVSWLNQNTVEIQILACSTIVATLVLKLGKVVASVNHTWLEVITFGQKVQQLFAVPGGLNLSLDLWFSQNLQNSVCLRLELFKLLYNLGSFLHQSCWHLLVRVETLVDIHGKVDHAGV